MSRSKMTGVLLAIAAAMTACGSKVIDEYMNVNGLGPEANTGFTVPRGGSAQYATVASACYIQTNGSCVPPEQVTLVLSVASKEQLGSQPSLTSGVSLQFSSQNLELTKGVLEGSPVFTITATADATSGYTGICSEDTTTKNSVCTIIRVDVQ